MDRRGGWRKCAGDPEQGQRMYSARPWRDGGGSYGNSPMLTAAPGTKYFAPVPQSDRAGGSLSLLSPWVETRPDPRPDDTSHSGIAGQGQTTEMGPARKTKGIQAESRARPAPPLRHSVRRPRHGEPAGVLSKLCASALAWFRRFDSHISRPPRNRNVTRTGSTSRRCVASLPPFSRGSDKLSRGVPDLCPHRIFTAVRRKPDHQPYSPGSRGRGRDLVAASAADGRCCGLFFTGAGRPLKLGCRGPWTPKSRGDAARGVY